MGFTLGSGIEPIVKVNVLDYQKSALGGSRKKAARPKYAKGPVAPVAGFVAANALNFTKRLMPVKKQGMNKKPARLDLLARSAGAVLALGVFFFAWAGAARPGEPVLAGFPAAGDYHSLVVDGSANLWALGDNSFGQAGLGALPTALYPVLVMKNVKTALVSHSSSYAISFDGTLWAWGDNREGLLGTGDTAVRSVPEPLLGRVVCISVSGRHALAVDESGAVWAWGENSFGQLGNASRGNSPVPVKVMEGASQALACKGFSLAIGRENTLWAWGDNRSGQLGITFPEESGRWMDKPHPVLSNVLKASGGEGHTLALRTDDSLWAWGGNDSGQVGDGGFELRLAPVKIMDNIADMACGPGHSLALDRDGRLWGFGSNHYGQLGLGGVENTPKPMLVLEEVDQIFEAETYSLALDKRARLWFMGFLSAPDGLGTEAVSSKTPQLVSEKVETAAAGANHVLFIKEDGSLWGFGSNNFGELGVMPLEFMKKPVKISFQKGKAETPQ